MAVDDPILDAVLRARDEEPAQTGAGAAEEKVCFLSLFYACIFLAFHRFLVLFYLLHT